MAQYELNLRDYWRVIRKKKFIIIFSTVMLGLFSFIFAYTRKPIPVYSTSASLKYQKTTSMAESAMMSYGYYGEGGGELATHAELVKSYTTVELAAKKLGWIDSTLSSDEVRDNRELMGMIMRLKGKIATQQEGYTNILNIYLTSSLGYPFTTTKDLADFVNALAHAYAEWDAKSKRRNLSSAGQFLKDQLDSAKIRLREASLAVQKFREEHEFITLDGAIGALLAQLNRAKISYERLRKNREETERLIDGLKKDRSLFYITSTELFLDFRNPIIASLKGRLATLRAKQDEFLFSYTEDHPLISQLDTQMSKIEKKILNELEVLNSNLYRQEISQKKILDQLELEYKKLPKLGLQLAEKQQKLTFAATLYASLEAQYQQARLREQERPSELILVKSAFTPDPEYPDNPPTTKTPTAVGMIVGLIMGLLLAFIAETMDTSIGTIEDVEAFLETTVLGVIPFVKPEEAKEKIRKKRPDLVDEEILDMQARLVSQFDPKSSLAESYRSLRTNLQFAGIEKETKTIVMTSSSAREGKTTVSTNLAVAMAQIGNKTLLVGADLRKPAMARVFGIDREPGLTEIMLGKIDWHEALRTLTDLMMGKMPSEELLATPGIDNLNIITSGKIPPNPSEIISSKRMSDFLKLVREEYDVVIIDTTPILQATDAALLCSQVDGTVMVYQVGKVARGALKRAKTQLENVKANILGVVLNGLRAEISPDYAAYRYGAYYSYGVGREVEEEGGFFLLRWIRKLLRKIRGGAEAGVEGVEKPKPEKEKSFFQRFRFWRNRGVKVAGPQAQVEKTVKEEFVGAEPEKGPAGLQPERPQAVTPPPPQAAGAEGGPYTVHIDSYREKGLADIRVEQLESAGFVSFSQMVDLGERGRGYRIYVGRFSSKEEAQAAADLFIKEGLTDYAMVYELP